MFPEKCWNLEYLQIPVERDYLRANSWSCTSFSDTPSLLDLLLVCSNVAAPLVAQFGAAKGTRDGTRGDHVACCRCFLLSSGC